jgi:DNA polymerase delta subunit 1
MMVQGIETVRRDNCLMVRKLVTVILDLLLKERDPEAAVKHVKGVIADLLLNRVDMSDLVVSKNLSQVWAITIDLPSNSSPWMSLEAIYFSWSFR